MLRTLVIFAKRNSLLQIHLFHRDTERHERSIARGLYVEGLYAPFGFSYYKYPEKNVTKVQKNKLNSSEIRLIEL